MKKYFLFILIACFSCSDQQDSNNEKNTPIEPISSIKQAHIYRSTNAEVDIEILAPLINNFTGDSAKMEFPQGVKAIFFNDDMTIKSVLTAGYAIKKQATNELLLEQNVRIVSYKNEDTIYCEDLIWQDNTKRIYTNKPIRRHSKTGTDYGEGLEANETMDSVVIVRPRGHQVVEE